MKKDASPKRASYITGPDGQVLTEAGLPAAKTRRWVARRKAEVIAAVRGGLLNLNQACERYQISGEEFVAWDRAYERNGLSGLRACRSRSKSNGVTSAPDRVIPDQVIKV
jgi:hypothetical protein